VGKVSVYPGSFLTKAQLRLFSFAALRYFPVG